MLLLSNGRKTLLTLWRMISSRSAVKSKSSDSCSQCIPHYRGVDVKRYWRKVSPTHRYRYRYFTDALTFPAHVQCAHWSIAGWPGWVDSVSRPWPIPALTGLDVEQLGWSLYADYRRRGIGRLWGVGPLTPRTGRGGLQRCVTNSCT